MFSDILLQFVSLYNGSVLEPPQGKLKVRYLKTIVMLNWNSLLEATMLWQKVLMKTFFLKVLYGKNLKIWKKKVKNMMKNVTLQESKWWEKHLKVVRLRRQLLEYYVTTQKKNIILSHDIIMEKFSFLIVAQIVHHRARFMLQLNSSTVHHKCNFHSVTHTFTSYILFTLNPVLTHTASIIVI